MNVALVTPSTSPSSSIGMLSRHTLAQLCARDEPTTVVDLCTLDLNALVTGPPQACPGPLEPRLAIVAAAHSAVVHSYHVVIISPVYNGACAGLVKLFLDSLPRAALEGANVLVMGSAGTHRHGLALTYSLVPVVVEMGSTVIVRPLCLGPDDWTSASQGDKTLTDRARDRLARRLDALLGATRNAAGTTNDSEPEVHIYGRLNSWPN